MTNVVKLLTLTIAVLMTLPSPAIAQQKPFKDKDWSVGTYDNCGFPNKIGSERPVSWVKVDGDRKLRFVLQEGQKGRCPNDNQFRSRAPYWERAEVRQKGFMKLGQAYRISIQVTFEQGFVGDRESFFQIHGYNKSCPGAPPMMMKFSRGQLAIWALRGVRGTGLGDDSGRHTPVQNAKIDVRQLYGKPSEFILDFDTRGPKGRLSVWLNGRQIVQNAAIEYAPCATPYIKMGIYRPGGKGSGTSSAFFDDLKIQKVK